MAPVRGQKYMIARPQFLNDGVILETQASTAAEQKDPLVPFLVVPEVRTRHMTTRDDALQPKRRGLEERLDVLVQSGGRDVIEEIRCHAEGLSPRVA